MSDLGHALGSIPWFAWVAIVAIVCSSVSTSLHQRRKHLERMEMIRMGMNPDSGKSVLPPEV